MGAPITDAAEALAFALGGRATFTVRSRKTGTRYTYKLKAKDGGNLFFAHTLTGSNNEEDYTYLGTWWPHDGRGLVAGAKGNPSDVRFRGLRYVLGNLTAGRMPDDVEFWHEGRCARCSRKLTDPESIARGFGPECATKVAA